VRGTRAELGSVVAPGSVLGEVTSSEDLEVRLPLALKDYGFLEVDDAGRPSGQVTLRAEVGGGEIKWGGRIVRSENEVDRKTLSIYVVAEIEANEQAPPGFELPPVGLFVHAELTGSPLKQVVALPRLAIRERDRDRARVFVVEEQGEAEVLGFRDVHVRLSDRETAYIDEGLDAGDRVVLTKIDAPVAGKKLKVIEPQADTPEKVMPAESESVEN
jgi:multidrug efflux pump subunit AcrA (membrane-fusion protein)